MYTYIYIYTQYVSVCHFACYARKVPSQGMSLHLRTWAALLQCPLRLHREHPLLARTVV